MTRDFRRLNALAGMMCIPTIALVLLTRYWYPCLNALAGMMCIPTIYTRAYPSSDPVSLNALAGMMCIPTMQRHLPHRGSNRLNALAGMMCIPTAPWWGETGAVIVS